MRLNDLVRLDTNPDRTRWAGPIRDARGEESHFATIEGPQELVEEVFSESEFDIMIVPNESREDWERRLDDFLLAKGENNVVPNGVRYRGLFKPTPEVATEDTSLAMTLQSTRPAGTSYLLAVPFAVPRGASLFFVLPPVCSAAGVSFPTAGDPDLFLMLTPSGPTVSASASVGLATDAVSFALPVCLPFLGFVPFFRVFGFLTSTGVLVFGGSAFP
jgi:hypothetical protein